MSSNPRQKFLAHALLLATVAVWGSTFVLVKDALRDASPLLFNQLRMTLAFAILAVVHAREWRRMGRGALLSGLIAGIFLALGYEFQTAGLASTTPAKSAFLTGLVVVLVPLLGCIPGIRGKGSPPLRFAAVAGAVCAFCGIVLLTTPAGTTFANLGSTINRGDVLSLACAFAFALHLLSLARLARRVPTAQLATLQIGFAAVVMTILTPMLERPHLHVTPLLLWALGICAVFATAAAFSIQSWAQQHLKASHTALLLALEPAFALLFSILFLHEHLGRRSGLGALLILSSLGVTELLSPAGVAGEPEANLPHETASG